MKTKLKPVEIAFGQVMWWIIAHRHLIANTTHLVTIPHWAKCTFITLKSGHQLYGYSSSAVAEWDTMPSAEDFADLFADNPVWTEAIRDIPALYDYYEPY